MPSSIISRRAGLSPRGRGKRVSHANNQPRARSIPAWAGETLNRWRIAPHQGVYPRVGGGNAQIDSRVHSRQGLSPRGRGKPTSTERSRLTVRSIPAWAGETICLTAVGTSDEVYPRVGGGNRTLINGRGPNPGLSPRGRGKHWALIRRHQHARSIPAWAGETLCRPVAA